MAAHAAPWVDVRMGGRAGHGRNGSPEGEAGNWGGRKTCVFHFTRGASAPLRNCTPAAPSPTHMILMCAVTTVNIVSLSERVRAAPPLFIYHIRDIAGCVIANHQGCSDQGDGPRSATTSPICDWSKRVHICDGGRTFPTRSHAIALRTSRSTR
jgi:hypothetical protein